MKHLSLVLAIGLAFEPGLAAAQVVRGDQVGTDAEAIRAALTAAGYTVERIEREGAGFEAYARLDGQLFYIDIGRNGAVGDIDRSGE